MNNDEFLQRLTEVSEWHRPQMGPSGCVSGRRGHTAPPHPGVITEADLEDMTDQQAQSYYEQLMAWRDCQPNETTRPVIMKLKFTPQPCPACSQELTEHRVVEHTVYQSGGRHWRNRCKNCKKFQHPVTQEFSMTPAEARSTFFNYNRPRKNIYKSKYNPAPKAGVRDALMTVIHEDQDSMILVPRRHGDK